MARDERQDCYPLIWALLASHGKPGGPRRVRSLAEALRRGLVPRRYMGEALAILREIEANPRPCPPSPPDPSWRHNNDPWLDNAVRALEGD